GDGGPYADAVTVIPGEYEFRSGWTEYNWSSKTCVANTTGGNWSGNTWVSGSWAGALGPGDHPASQGIPDGRAPSIGWGGVMIVEFRDNRLVPNGIPGNNSTGGDLMILERGQEAEPAAISISKDGVTWIPVGQLSGSSNANTQYFDIDGVANPGDEFRFVKIQDLGQSHYSLCSSNRNYAGADIDAVWAISSVTTPVSPTIVEQA